jgi:hypothetical protein
MSINEVMIGDVSYLNMSLQIVSLVAGIFFCLYPKSFGIPKDENKRRVVRLRIIGALVVLSNLIGIAKDFNFL